MVDVIGGAAELLRVAVAVAVKAGSVFGHDENFPPPLPSDSYTISVTRHRRASLIMIRMVHRHPS